MTANNGMRLVHPGAIRAQASVQACLRLEKAPACGRRHPYLIMRIT